MEKLHHWGTVDMPKPGLYYALLGISGFCGVAIGWTSINAQQYVTATTMLLITNLNKVVVIIYGMIFLSEPDGPFAIGGCIIALGGGVYSGVAWPGDGVAGRSAGTRGVREGGSVRWHGGLE